MRARKSRGGGRPPKIDKVKALMRKYCREHGAPALEAMFEKDMEAEFGVSRGICRKARNTILAKTPAK